MRPQKCLITMADQLAGREYGDCWRACIASILEMPCDDVPNFVHLARLADGNFHTLSREWLAERGWALFARAFGAAEWPFDRLVDWLASSGPGVAFIVAGDSGGQSHAVVALDGTIHDPSDCGIQGPHDCDEEGCNCGGFWWVYVIAPFHGDTA